MRRPLALLLLGVFLVPTLGMGVRACLVECPMADDMQPELASVMTHCPMAESPSEGMTPVDESSSRTPATLKRALPDCCSLTEVPAEPPTLPILPSSEATVSLAGPTLTWVTLPASANAIERLPMVSPPRVPIFRRQRALLL
ncbi:MAG: hypothetical protein K8J08_09985 [Thermoanaerobaculia bacterium]|nr:hypothetical protein [Thermoanaerobaculia bacterium]